MTKLRWLPTTYLSSSQLPPHMLVFALKDGVKHTPGSGSGSGGGSGSKSKVAALLGGSIGSADDSKAARAAAEVRNKYIGAGAGGETNDTVVSRCFFFPTFFTTLFLSR
jgi:hypothetical protein